MGVTNLSGAGVLAASSVLLALGVEQVINTNDCEYMLA